jgi:lipopolysaccharide transport system permease protein
MQKTKILEVFPVVKYSHLIMSFAIMDLKLRYKNSFLGFVWSFLEPLLMLSVLYYVFGSLFPSKVQNFPLFLLLGLIMWYMYARSTSSGLTSIISRGGILSKVYLPREIMPIAACVTSFMMMAFEFFVFAFFIAIFQFSPPATILALPLILLVEFVLCVGTSLLLSIANVYFRDVQYIWAIVLQAGFFISPIFYKLEQFPANIRDLLALNPLAGLLTMSHELVLYNTLPTPAEIAYPVLTSLAVLAIGYFVFRKLEWRAIEVI